MKTVDPEVILELEARISKLTVLDARLFGTAWVKVLKPGQWLKALGAKQQARLDGLISSELKQAISDFWLDPKISPEDLAGVALPTTLLTLARHSKKQAVQLYVALQDNSPAEALSTIATSKYETVRKWVAKHPNSPSGLFGVLANDKDWDVRSELAGNPGISLDMLQVLAQDESAFVRCAVARSSLATKEILAGLAMDSNSLVRSVVARNPKLPDQARLALSSDEEPQVKLGIIANPSTDSDMRAALLIPLAQGGWTEAIWNPHVPSAILAEHAAAGLAGSKDQVARLRDIVCNPNVPPQLHDALISRLIADSSFMVRADVARSPIVTQDILALLANDPSDYVRRMVARNPKLEGAVRKQVFDLLSTDADQSVRRVVANSPMASEEVLLRLLQDANLEVVVTAANNPNITIHSSKDGDSMLRSLGDGPLLLLQLNRALAKAEPNVGDTEAIKSWTANLTASISGDKPVSVLVSVEECRIAFTALRLISDNADTRSISKASKSKDWLQRVACIYAPGVQSKLLKSMTEDASVIVRRCAEARLAELAG
jgi:hypothetical protein